MALPRASRSGDIALAGSCRLRSMLAATPDLFAHAVAAVVKNWLFLQPLDLMARMTSPESRGVTATRTQQRQIF